MKAIAMQRVHSFTKELKKEIKAFSQKSLRKNKKGKANGTQERIKVWLQTWR